MHRYDIRAGSCVVDRLGEPVTHLAAAHDGESLLAMCTDGVVRMLDRATGELLVTYQGMWSVLNAVLYQRVVCVCLFWLCVQVYMYCGCTYTGHKQTDTRLECGFSVKDDYVYAASEDGMQLGVRMCSVTSLTCRVCVVLGGGGCHSGAVVSGT